MKKLNMLISEFLVSWSLWLRQWKASTTWMDRKGFLVGREIERDVQNNVVQRYCVKKNMDRTQGWTVVWMCVAPRTPQQINQKKVLFKYLARFTYSQPNKSIHMQKRLKMEWIEKKCTSSRKTNITTSFFLFPFSDFDHDLTRPAHANMSAAEEKRRRMCTSPKYRESVAR